MDEQLLLRVQRFSDQLEELVKEARLLRSETNDFGFEYHILQGVITGLLSLQGHWQERLGQVKEKLANSVQKQIYLFA